MVGHSYVKYLQRLGGWDNVVEVLDSGESVKFEFSWLAFPGKDFEYFINNPAIFQTIKRRNPDIIVTILGGNAITNAVTNEQIKSDARRYFELQKEACGGNCLRLAFQVERRFAAENNRFNVPQEHQYNQRRALLNNFLNKSIRKGSGLVHNIINLGGDDYLNNPNNFSDGVHLKIEGLMLYQKIMINGLVYALNHRQ